MAPSRTVRTTVRTTILAVSAAALLTACGSSPEKKKFKAEAEKTEEETKTMQEYKQCIKKAKTDPEKLNACEYIIKAVSNTGS